MSNGDIILTEVLTLRRGNWFTTLCLFRKREEYKVKYLAIYDIGKSYDIGYLCLAVHKY